MTKYCGIFKVFVEEGDAYRTWKYSYKDSITEAKKELLSVAEEEARFYWKTAGVLKTFELEHIEPTNKRFGGEILLQYEQEML